MSIPVTLEALREAIDRQGAVAYFLSAGSDGRPHTVQLRISWVDTGHLVLHPGNSTIANVQARPLVSLLWPPAELGGYSLIVDGAVVDVLAPGNGNNTVSVQPTKAVLHRPAPPDSPKAATGGSDCVGVFASPA
jgi:hypothetical protein